MHVNLITAAVVLVMGGRAAVMLTRQPRPYRALSLAFWALLACSFVSGHRDLFLPPAAICLLLAVAARRREVRRPPETFRGMMEEVDLPDYDAVNRRDLPAPPEPPR